MGYLSVRVCSFASLSELIESTRFGQKLPKTSSSHRQRKWISGLKNPRSTDSHRILWSAHISMGGKASWNQLSPHIRQFFNPVDLAMGKAMTRTGGDYMSNLVLESAEITELSIRLAGTVEALVTLF